MPILQGSSSYLQGNSPSLQGGSLNLQGSPTTTPTVSQTPKKITYGNTSATSPAKQQYISSLAQTDNNPTALASANQDYLNANPNAFGTPSVSQNNGLSTVSNPQTPLDTAKSDYLTSLKAAISGLQTAQQNQGTLTPEALKAQEDLNTFRGQEQQGLIGLTGQGRGIPLELVRGQQGKLLAQGQAQEQTLQNEFANKQAQSIAKRAGDVAAAQTALGFYNPKPESVSVGSNLVRLNPTTGQYETVAQGQSYVDKQGQQAVFSLYKTYPDAGIDPTTDDYATAQAKAAASQSFTNKSSQVQTIANPLTGAISVIPTKSYNSANAASVQNYNNQTPTFTLASDGKTVLANGTPVDLNTFRQLTGQTGANTDFSMVNKSKGLGLNLGGSRSTGGTIPTNPNDVYNLDLAKSLAATNGQIIGQTAQTSIGLNNFNQTAQLVLQSMQGLGLNPNDYPDLNSLDQAFRARGGDAGIISAYRNSIQTLRSDYSAILGQRGNLTPSQISSEINRTIPEDLNPSQLATVLERVQKEGGINLQNQQGALNIIRNNVTNIPFNTGTAAPVPNFNSNAQSTPASLFNGLF